MRKHLLVALALAAVAAAATAVPAFTADSGTVTVSITAQAPPAPCLTVTPGSVSFGTLAFSTPVNAGHGVVSGDANVTINSCGTAGENLLGSATNAVSASGTWIVTNSGIGGSPCPNLDRFFLHIFMFAFPDLALNGTPTPVSASDGTPAVLTAGTSYPSRLTIEMPCQGSNGAGETKTLTVTFTAVVP
jgi:hypothetical protein